MPAQAYVSHVQQDLLILQELLISHKKDATCTARSAYVSRTTDFSQEQMPHVQQDLLMFQELCKNRQYKDLLILQELLISHKNRCYIATDISQEQDATCTARSVDSVLFLELHVQQRSAQELLISHRTDATCTARSAYVSRTTDILIRTDVTSRSAYPSRATDISARTDATCTARSDYPSRTTDLTQEQMPHVQQDLLMFQNY
ncbi:unnamed protein product [Mytilus edulis]|uniref:Uncharacterized protein n=1 Tax=Mytilus edulis TaxID=6550 RepID=A0A8S3Q2R9_MYTED|nr:unnamed protein product [Mytilus edulis]